MKCTQPDNLVGIKLSAVKGQTTVVTEVVRLPSTTTNKGGVLHQSLARGYQKLGFSPSGIAHTCRHLLHDIVVPTGPDKTAAV
jgi:hypothetical protein